MGIFCPGMQYFEGLMIHCPAALGVTAGESILKAYTIKALMKRAIRAVMRIGSK
jgi:hypothetical protein